MDALSQVSSSINTVNQALEVANMAIMQQADKLMKFAVETSVGTELGKGQNIDVSG